MKVFVATSAQILAYFLIVIGATAIMLGGNSYDITYFFFGCILLLFSFFFVRMALNYWPNKILVQRMDWNTFLKHAFIGMFVFGILYLINVFAENTLRSDLSRYRNVISSTESKNSGLVNPLNAIRIASPLILLGPFILRNIFTRKETTALQIDDDIQKEYYND